MFSPGTLLDGRYEVIELLGRGGMGEVWRARRRLLGDEVAIKAIRPIDAAAPAERAHFLRESRACAQLRHPHIVSILDFDVAPGGEPFLVMELLNGPSLRDELRRRGRLPLEEVVAIAGPVATAVQLAHDRGFVHRDLKPANLVSHSFASGEVVWKVIDFGLADLVGGNSETRPSSGREVAATVLYAAPEQLRGLPVDHRADVYAFGALLFEALSGRPPFPDGDLLAVVTAHLSQAPPRLSEVGVEAPASVEDALARALDKDPAARWPRIVDLAEALQPDGAAPARVQAGAAVPAWPHGLGRYAPEGRIGRGRLGSDIVAARHRVLDTRVAVRLLRRATTINWEAVRTRFLHEARALQVVHPAILRVLDAGEEDGLLYLVTDLVEGRSLREVLARDGALDAGRLVRFARQLFDAATALHARGSVLCGLSPEIVRTTGEGAAERLVVSTGGIAQVQDLLATLSEDTLRGAGVLDPELPYVAPEVFLGRPADARADLFTLGVLVYEMATARLPFQASNMQQLIGTAISVRPHDPRLLQPGMPDAVADVALRCLSANPADRPASAADALASLKTEN